MSDPAYFSAFPGLALARDAAGVLTATLWPRARRGIGRRAGQGDERLSAAHYPSAACALSTRACSAAMCALKARAPFGVNAAQVRCRPSCAALRKVT